MPYGGWNGYQPFGVPYVFPGIMNLEEGKRKYLDALDSDTREYVMKHTDPECSRSDIEDCVAHLKGYH